MTTLFALAILCAAIAVGLVLHGLFSYITARATQAHEDGE